MKARVSKEPGGWEAAHAAGDDAAWSHRGPWRGLGFGFGFKTVSRLGFHLQNVLESAGQASKLEVSVDSDTVAVSG